MHLNNINSAGAPIRLGEKWRAAGFHGNYDLRVSNCGNTQSPMSPALTETKKNAQLCESMQTLLYMRVLNSSPVIFPSGEEGAMTWSEPRHVWL